MNLEKKLFEWEGKHIDELPITELSTLQYIIEHLPSGITYTVKSDKGIEDYIEERTNTFFEVTEEDYKKLVGKCFINEDKNVAVKVVGISDQDIDNFLYEKYLKSNDETWHTQDYIWLQEAAKGKYAEEEYKKWCLTSQTEMNINAEEMFMLGKDGNLYVDYSCGGDYDVYKPFGKATFELIREEAIERDGEYKAGE